MPYVVLEPEESFPGETLRLETVRLAAATGLLLVQEPAVTSETANTLTGALVAAGVPAFTVEAGGACGIVETSIQAGVAGVLGVLREHGMTSIEIDYLVRPSYASEVLDYTSRPHCTSSGIVRFCVTPGETVKQRQELARVYSAFGSVEETIRAGRPGYVLGVSDHARALPGAEVIAIAEFGQGSERAGGGPEPAATAAEVGPGR